VTIGSTEKLAVPWFKLALAGACGVLWAMAFPHWNLSGLGWLAPGLVLLCSLSSSRRVCFWCGCASGLTMSLTGLYWLLYMPVTGLPILGWIALSLYLSLYTGLWTWLCWKLFPSTSHSLQTPPKLPWLKQTGWSLFCAASWAGLETLQSHLFTGFPWNLLGASQSELLVVTQLASYTGVAGISFLMVWCSTSLLLAVFDFMGQSHSNRGFPRALFLPAVALIGVSGYGWRKLTTPAPPSAEIKIAMVQPSFPQTLIWDSSAADARLERMLELSRTALASKPDLLVWPESAAPYSVRFDTQTQQAVRTLLEKSQAWMVMGSDDAGIEDLKGGGTRTNYYNSAFLLDSSGGFHGGYAKRQLVIFGEYVPLAKWLPFLRWFTPVGHGFTSGDKRVAFAIPTPDARFAPLICFEDMFARVARDQAQSEIDFLLNITNDGWFDESAQQWQHAAHATFRAIENGIPLVRCSNNGITCWIDKHGRMSDPAAGLSKGAYSEGIQIIQVPLDRSPPAEWTFYRRHGEIFGWSCLGLAAVFTLLSTRSLRTSRDQ